VIGSAPNPPISAGKASLAPFRGRGKRRVAAKGEGGRASVSDRGGTNASGGLPPLPAKGKWVVNFPKGSQ
jgi:hypothetical protein